MVRMFPLACGKIISVMQRSERQGPFNTMVWKSVFVIDISIARVFKLACVWKTWFLLMSQCEIK